MQIYLFLKASLEQSDGTSLFYGSPSHSGESLGPLAWQCQVLQNQHLPTYRQPHQPPPYSIICFPANFMLFLEHKVLHVVYSHVTLKAQLNCCHLKEALTNFPGRMTPLYTHKDLSLPYTSTYSIFNRHLLRDLLCGHYSGP